MSLKDSLRLMVVDDMSTSRGIITNMLDELGLTHWVSESDGQKALRKLSASPVHLVLSDYNMPNMDGLQLLEALRLNKLTHQIGFILVTGKATSEIIRKGQQLGMNNYIEKPFTTRSMKHCIERVVGPL